MIAPAQGQQFRHVLHGAIITVGAMIQRSQSGGGPWVQYTYAYPGKDEESGEMKLSKWADFSGHLEPLT